MKPIIGIQAQIDPVNGNPFIDARYEAWVREAGGLPVVFSPVANVEEAREVAETFDGILLPGGDDIDPALYGEAPLPTTQAPVAVRDVGEPLLIAAVLAADVPFMAICRGMQMAHVALGGALMQDIAQERETGAARAVSAANAARAESTADAESAACAPNANGIAAIAHRQGEPFDAPTHPVHVMENTPLSRALADAGLGADIAVNSLHHQAVRLPLAKGLELMACAPDGIPEALFCPHRTFFWGVQWHPEMMPDDACGRIIARAFTDAASKRQGRR